MLLRLELASKEDMFHGEVTIFPDAYVKTKCAFLLFKSSVLNTFSSAGTKINSGMAPLFLDLVFAAVAPAPAADAATADETGDAGADASAKKRRRRPPFRRRKAKADSPKEA